MGKNSPQSAAAIYNETFEFTFGWYALLAVWVVCWHPVFLRVWLHAKPELVPGVTSLFVPIVISFCFGALANISTAQLASLNRVGIEMGFNIANGVVRAVCVLCGWYWGGLVGTAWGILASRVVTLAQDLYAIRIIGGGGWLAWGTWRHLAGQCAVGLAFFLFVREASVGFPGQILLALAHGGIVALWLLRPLVRKYLKRPRSAG